MIFCYANIQKILESRPKESQKNRFLFAVYQKTATFAAELIQQTDENIRKYILVVALFTTHKVVRDEGRMYNRDKIKRSVALAADLFFF